AAHLYIVEWFRIILTLQKLVKFPSVRNACQIWIVKDRCNLIGFGPKQKTLSAERLFATEGITATHQNRCEIFNFLRNEVYTSSSWLSRLLSKI
ncbi:MAG TPA: hypothetical protein VGD99_02975, partial [Anaerolineae bacterium]